MPEKKTTGLIYEAWHMFLRYFLRGMEKSCRKPTTVLLRVEGKHLQGHLHAPQQVGVGVSIMF